MGKINTRSPYHIHTHITNLTSASLDLYVYTGTQTSSRGSAVYSIDTIAIDETVDFEISELVKDYLDTNFDSNYTGQNVWVDYQITQTIVTTPTVLPIVQLTGFNGYGYFEEGINPQLSSNLLISNNAVYKLNDTNVVIPVQQDNLNSIFYFKDGEVLKTETYTPTSLNTDITRYVSYGVVTVIDYKDRIADDDGTFEDSKCLQDALDAITAYDIDKIQFNFSDEIKIVDVIDIEECKHTPYKLTFVNKFGALQDFWFFKRTNKSLSVSENKYKSNILVSSGSKQSYSVSSHQNRILNKQGKEKLTLNSGYYNEDSNEVFTQMLLSEKVWITYNAQVLPISITSSSLAFKTQLNDKLISYTIECEFAFDKINNVR